MAGELIPQPFATGPAPAGGHSEGNRTRGRLADLFKNSYHWTRKRLPSPGAQNYAFESLELAEFTPIGPSVRARMFLNSLQPPQLYVWGQALPTQGLGGLASGQIILQPLIDPYNDMYGGQAL